MPEGTISTDQLKKALFTSFSALYIPAEGTHNKYAPIFGSQDKLQNCFEVYFDHIIKQFSDDSLSLLLAQYTNNTNQQVKLDKIDKFAKDMARSLNSFIGKIGPEGVTNVGFNDDGSLKAGIIENATASLNTDLSASFDRVQTYKDAISALFDQAFIDSRDYIPDDINQSFANYLVKNIGSNLDFVNLAPSIGPISFAIKGPINHLLIQQPNLSPEQVKNFFSAYLHIVSGLLKEIAHSNKPFVNTIGQNFYLDNTFLTGALSGAAELAIQFKDQNYEIQTDAQTKMGKAIAKSLKKDHDLKNRTTFQAPDTQTQNQTIELIKAKVIEYGALKIQSQAEKKTKKGFFRQFGTWGRSAKPAPEALNPTTIEPMTDAQYELLLRVDNLIRENLENNALNPLFKYAFNLFQRNFYNEDNHLKSQSEFNIKDFDRLSFMTTHIQELPHNTRTDIAFKDSLAELQPPEAKKLKL